MIQIKSISFIKLLEQVKKHSNAFQRKSNRSLLNTNVRVQIFFHFSRFINCKWNWKVGCNTLGTYFKIFRALVNSAKWSLLYLLLKTHFPSILWTWTFQKNILQYILKMIIKRQGGHIPRIKLVSTRVAFAKVMRPNNLTTTIFYLFVPYISLHDTHKKNILRENMERVQAAHNNYWRLKKIGQPLLGLLINDYIIRGQVPLA